MEQCPRCGGNTKKAGQKVRAGELQQMYLCNDCGYNFWLGQIIRTPVENPPCPKCEGSTQRYGTGFKGGQKCRKFRCSSCGHVFLTEPDGRE